MKRVYCSYCNTMNYYKESSSDMDDKQIDEIYDGREKQTCISCGAPLNKSIRNAIHREWERTMERHLGILKSVWSDHERQ